MAVPVIHDFAALLMVYLNIVKSKTAQHNTIGDLNDFLERWERHLDFYALNSDISKTYEFFKKLIDNFKEIVYNNNNVQKS